jgi:hypothetical protein
MIALYLFRNDLRLLIGSKLADTHFLGTEEIKEILELYLTLTPTTVGVLTCALNLPKRTRTDDGDLKYTIYMDNLFTSYKLFSILRQNGIAACGTARANPLGDHFKEEILKENNGKML